MYHSRSKDHNLMVKDGVGWMDGQTIRWIIIILFCTHILCIIENILMFILVTSLFLASHVQFWQIFATTIQKMSFSASFGFSYSYMKECSKLFKNVSNRFLVKLYIDITFQFFINFYFFVYKK